MFDREREHDGVIANPLQLFYWCLTRIQEADQFCGKK
jgi:hypothetical protein